MSDQQMTKKVTEELDFCDFAAAYEHASGHSLNIVASDERPDFICIRSDGWLCGLEFTKLCGDPMDRILRGPSMPLVQALEMLPEIILKKDEKRRSKDWKLPNDAIVVVQLMEISLGEIASILDGSLADALAECGFAEVWLADYTTLEPFREVELYCVLPAGMRGHYERANADRKPYG